jgi:hypothetical protein
MVSVSESVSQRESQGKKEESEVIKSTQERKGLLV